MKDKTGKSRRSNRNSRDLNMDSQNESHSIQQQNEAIEGIVTIGRYLFTSKIYSC